MEHPLVEPAADDWLEPIADPAERRHSWALPVFMAGLALTLLAGGWFLTHSPRVSAALLGVVRPARAEVPSQRVESVLGAASIRPKGAAIRLALEPGVLVYPGDSFEVGPASTLKVALGPTASATLYRDTRATLISTGESSQPSAWLRLDKGLIVVELGSHPDIGQAIVVTPWGMVSTTTSAGIQILPDSRGLSVACFGGDCRLKLSDAQQVIADGTALTYLASDGSITFSDLAGFLDPEAWAVAAIAPTPTSTSSPTSTWTLSPLPPTPPPTAPIARLIQPSQTSTGVPSASPLPTDTPQPPPISEPPTLTATPDPPTPTEEPSPRPTRDRGGGGGGGDGGGDGGGGGGGNGRGGRGRGK